MHVLAETVLAAVEDLRNYLLLFLQELLNLAEVFHRLLQLLDGLLKKSIDVIKPLIIFVLCCRLQRQYLLVQGIEARRVIHKIGKVFLQFLEPLLRSVVLFLEFFYWFGKEIAHILRKRLEWRLHLIDLLFRLRLRLQIIYGLIDDMPDINLLSKMPNLILQIVVALLNLFIHLCE